MPTLADLLAVNVFDELDDWNYEEEEEDTTAGVREADVIEVSISANNHY